MRSIMLLALLAALSVCMPNAARAEGDLPTLTNYLSDELYQKAVPWENCDDSALAAVMKKAERGEDITVALIGGSITEGTISNGSKDGEVPFKLAYAEIFRRWWTERFPNVKVSFVNAGIGGTDSYLGVHRLRMDVLSKKPDVVLVEYAVNDDGSKLMYKVSYDSLVRRILESETKPAVLLLFMGQTNGATAEGIQAQIGSAYRLPMVSYIDVIKAAMKDGTYPAKVLSGDTVHPSALGHALTGEILWRYLNGVYARRDSLGEPAPFAAEAFTQDKYQNPKLFSGGNLIPDDKGSFTTGTGSTCWHYQRGWVNQQGAGNFTATLTFRNLGILYQRTVDGKSGKYDILVDGKRVGTIDGHFPNGWGNAITATEIFSGEESAPHTVIVTQADGSDGKLILLGFLTSD